MARVKPNNLYPIKDLPAANAALAEIAVLKRQIEQIEGELNEQIDRLKADAEARAASLQTSLSAIEGGLLAFAEYNKTDLFADKRSKELDFGMLGYRRSKEIRPRPKHTWAMILGRIKELGFTGALRVEEKVNKDELHQWPDERLELIGAQRVEKDSFWYEIDQQKIADMAA
ncbi:MAG: host-nuclease inhibitor Gam family protein [Desulfobacterales bacterium]|jgi:phage host-nuclease inhibitor protein Gam|nr:host-nuclease inhibitor Gam family protein [Desulfobacterales bacterium]